MNQNINKILGKYIMNSRTAKAFNPMCPMIKISRTYI